MILDIHTHSAAPRPEAIICAEPDKFAPVPEQLYSVGIHPWSTANATDEELLHLDELSARSDVAIIGETGIDMSRPDAAPLFRQLLLFRHHAELSEKLCKPLLIHEVKAHDIILGLRNDLQPRQPWIIHGFRGKPSVAQMLMRPGIYFSFGEKFNPETLRALPTDRILAETDCSSLPIEQIIASLSTARGTDLLSTVAANTARLIAPAP